MTAITKDIKSLFLQDLLISAGDLADSFLWVDRVDQDGVKVNHTYCNRCQRTALGAEELVHADDCLAGRVSKLIAAIEGPDVNGVDGAWLIQEERQRQVNVEEWPPEHDDEHVEAELVSAARAYLWVALCEVQMAAKAEDFRSVPNDWPVEWSHEWFKPSDDPIRNLVKAGALIAAEIDRLQRSSISGPDGIAEQGLPSATGHINPQPTEQHIAYEVEEHPWASEEGNCPNLGRPEILTHEEAAADRRGVLA